MFRNGQFFLEGGGGIFLTFRLSMIFLVGNSLCKFFDIKNRTWIVERTYSIFPQNLAISLCSVFNLNNKNVNALIARELPGFTCTRSLTINSKFSIKPRAVLKFLVHC